MTEVYDEVTWSQVCVKCTHWKRSRIRDDTGACMEEIILLSNTESFKAMHKHAWCLKFKASKDTKEVKALKQAQCGNCGSTHYIDEGCTNKECKTTDRANL